MGFPESKDKEAGREIEAKASYSRRSFESVSTLPQYEERDGNNSSRTPSSAPSKRKSRLSSAFNEMKAKIGSSGGQDSSERAEEKQRKKEEYERLGLGDKTKYGWGSGGMTFNG